MAESGTFDFCRVVSCRVIRSTPSFTSTYLSILPFSTLFYPILPPPPPPLPPNPPSPPSPPSQEEYANRLILDFKAGLLPLTDGTTLRTFLSKLLNCDPMRISKKFVGGNCIGKQVRGGGGGGGGGGGLQQGTYNRGREENVRLR